MNSTDTLDLARLAKTWPTAEELGREFGLSARHIRRLASDGDVRAFRLDVVRIDPGSFADWLTRRQH